MLNIVARDTPFKVIVGEIKLPVNVRLTAVAVPVKFGLANGAFKFNTVCVAVEIGLFTSDVLSTLPNPTIVLVTPATVPVKVGLAIGAFNAIELITVVEKLASLPSAVANSLSVSNEAGAESTKLDTLLLT